MIVRASILRSKTVVTASCATILALSSVAAAIQGETDPLDRLPAPSSALASHTGFADPEQAAQWREIQTTRQANIQQLKSILSTALDILKEDAASAEDLQLLAETTQVAVDELIGRMRLNRDRYLTLYAQLDPQQQAEARADLARTLDRLNHVLSLAAPVL